MGSRQYDLSTQDFDRLCLFITYLGSNTTWRTSLREANRLETISFWDLTRPNAAITGTYIGTVIDLLNAPVEELVTKKIYPLGWEQQVVNFRIKELE